MVAALDILYRLTICALSPMQEHLIVFLARFVIFFTAFLLFLFVGVSLMAMPSRNVCTECGKLRLKCGHKPLVWRMGRMCAQADSVQGPCWELTHFRNLSMFDLQGLSCGL